MGTPSPKRMIAYTRSTGATETSVMGSHRRCPQPIWMTTMNAIPAGRKPNSDMAGISSAHGSQEAGQVPPPDSCLPVPAGFFGLPPREGGPPQPEQGQRQHEPGSNVGEQGSGDAVPRIFRRIGGDDPDEEIGARRRDDAIGQRVPLQFGHRRLL